jgi:hypothetical protein
MWNVDFFDVAFWCADYLFISIRAEIHVLWKVVLKGFEESLIVFGCV